jgi:copper chaperone CopZ
MKPKTFSAGPLLLVLLTVVLTVGLISWGQKQSPDHYQQSVNDTVPKTKSVDREKKIRDLDDVLDELDAADMKVNMEQIKKEIAEAMKNIDGNKIKMEIENAMKEVDLEKIKKEVQMEMAKVDFNKIKEEMAMAMKDFDAAKIQQEVNAAMEKVNWDKMKAEFDRAKEMDMSKLQDEMKKVQDEMKDLGPKLKEEMEKAKVEIEKAKAEMKEYKEFVNGLENDGLINKKESYSIRHKNGELEVNGKKVSNEVYSKYRSFLEKHKKFNIEKSNDDFNIDMD